MAAHTLQNPVRIVTAASLFDGHDASINIMRRIMQSQGAEVIHLGHNRSVQEVVEAVLDEDANGVAVSSYQGGHVEYFEYLVQELAAAGAGHVKVVGGGGGVIVPDEIARLRESGVTIFSPQDGQRLGLPGMISSVLQDCDYALWDTGAADVQAVLDGDRTALSRAITGAEVGALPEGDRRQYAEAAAARTVPVLGITGTGGSGKSSLTDELVRRLRVDQEDRLRVAVVAVDPTRRKGGGALLGDRIRMNAITGDRAYFRSMATRGDKEVPDALPATIDILKAAGFDLVIVETPGIGQGDAGIVPLSDVSLYVMTPEFGAASQLEKIDMLDFADAVAINKFERRGAMDALRDVGRQLVRNREAFGKKPEDMPVFGTSAATFNDDGVTALYQELRSLLAEQGLPVQDGTLPAVDVRHSSGIRQVVPATRVRYLSEITETIRGYHADTETYAQAARRVERLALVDDELAAAGKTDHGVDELLEDARRAVPVEIQEMIEGWPARVESYSGDEQVVRVRDRELRTTLTKESLSGNKVPRVALPAYDEAGALVRYWRKENLPGYFPYTAGVFPFKRDNEDPARMFAGEGDPFRTNRRFKLLSEGQPATRLSTAFDSVTLYGQDPAQRPDIYGKVGTSGVSVAT
ncbi:MAG: methylmalonyl-CoA mutase, partial [Actinomycetales bacterium]|nr:methylmalonyl-CoA mutase [Actinomycetales bacterium]